MMRIAIGGFFGFLLLWGTLLLVWQKMDAARFADPVEVRKALDRSQRLIAGYDLGFESVFPQETNYTHWDEARAAQNRSYHVWPHLSASDSPDPLRFRLIPAADVAQGQGGSLAASSPVDFPFVLGHGESTFIALRGITKTGSLVIENYCWMICQGTMAGKIDNQSYATILVDGELSGQLTSDSYLCAVVTGPMTGKIQSTSYAMIYLLGGLKGQIDLGPSRVYVTGFTPQSELKRIARNSKYLNHSGVYLEESDLPAGDQNIDNLRVTVGKTAAAPRDSGDSGSIKP